MNKERVYYLKPFSKAWFINIWYHYKIHIILSAFVIALISFFVYEQVTKIRYDFSMYYISDKTNIAENALSDLQNKLDNVVPDINGDGKYHTYCKSFFTDTDKALTNEAVKAEIEQADIQVRSGDASVFLFESGKEEPYVGSGEDDQALYDLTYLADKYGYDNDSVKRYPNGNVYAICMKNNPLLNFDATDVYIVVRPLLDNDKKTVRDYNGALQMAEYIISRGEYELPAR